MHTYTLRGVEVEFPYDAYACQVTRCCCGIQDLPELLKLMHMCHMQLDYMERVIQALQEV